MRAPAYLEDTLEGFRYVRLEGVAKRLQRSGAVVENGEDFVLLGRREDEFFPIRVEGEPDVIGQPCVAGAGETMSERRDGARGEDYPRYEHRT